MFKMHEQKQLKELEKHTNFPLKLTTQKRRGKMTKDKPEPKTQTSKILKNIVVLNV